MDDTQPARNGWADLLAEGRLPRFALICALLLSWYVTAGTATHWYPGFKLPTPGTARSR